MTLGKLKNFIPIGQKNAGMIGYDVVNFNPIRGDVFRISEFGEFIEKHGHDGIHNQYNDLQGYADERLELALAGITSEEV